MTGILSGVIAPLVTPFRDDEILHEGLAANIEQMNETGLAGYFVLGTNGEYKSLAVEERFSVLDTVVRHRAPGKIVMAGMGFESTKETIEKTLKAAERGADLVSLLMPHFFAKKMTPAVLAGYILAVAEASPVPVVLYNNPPVAAGVTVGPETIRAVKDHPNVAGIKDSGADTFRQNLEAAGGRMAVLAGSANFFIEVLKLGGSGGVLSLANVFPAACARLYDLFRAGRLAEAEALDRTLVELNRKVSGSFGVAGVKAAMDLCGFCGGEPRRPLLPLSEEQRETLRASLAESPLQEQP
jgi:4-hydroxy-2-oxoglutarate aldolase